MKRFLLRALTILLLLGALAGCQRTTEEPEMPTRLNIPINTYSAQDFTESDGFLRYPGALLGVDVSSHQEQIDWEKVRAQGVDFAVLQLGYRGFTEGGLNVDERFLENLDAARGAGLQIGVYFFSQALTVQEAQEEADFVLRTLNHCPLELPVFFDWEEVAEGRTAQKATTEVTAYARAFCDRILAAGYTPGVYYNQLYGYSVLRLDELDDTVFWLAEYNPSPSFYYDFEFWQYTSHGAVDGIDGRVDVNLWFPKEESD